MQGTWDNDQAYYRCTFPSEYARTNRVQHPRAVYLREAEVVPELDRWLAKAFDPARLPETLTALAASQVAEVSPETARLREDIAGSDRQLDQYKAALDAGGDPAVIGQWITEAQARKLAAEAQLYACGAQASASAGQMSKEEIAAVVNSISRLMTALQHAKPHAPSRATWPDPVSGQRENHQRTNEQCSRQPAGTTSQQRSTLPDTGGGTFLGSGLQGSVRFSAHPPAATS